MATLQTPFILKAQWLTCPDSACLKAFRTSGWSLSHNWDYHQSTLIENLLCELCRLEHWTLCLPPLLLRSGHHSSSLPRSCWESKKRWCMIKQTGQYSWHSSWSPKRFPIGNHIPYVYACVYVCLPTWSMRWAEKPYKTKTASLGSLLTALTQHSLSLCAAW